MRQICRPWKVCSDTQMEKRRLWTSLALARFGGSNRSDPDRSRLEGTSKNIEDCSLRVFLVFKNCFEVLARAQVLIQKRESNCESTSYA